MEIFIPIALIVALISFFAIFGRRLLVWSNKIDAEWSEYEVRESIRRKLYREAAEKEMRGNA